MHVHPPIQSGRASVEPTCSTVDLRQLSLDSPPTSPTRSRAQRGRRSSVPGRLSVSASLLAGLGKEKKTGNKKTPQQTTSCEGSSRVNSNPTSPAQGALQTGADQPTGSSLGAGALALTPSRENEGRLSKQSSYEDLKLSPSVSRPPLQKQDSSLSNTSTTSDGEQVGSTQDIRMYIHNNMHTYIHTYIRTYVHTYIHTYIRTHTHTHTHIHIHIHTHTYIHTCMHTYIHTYVRM